MCFIIIKFTHMYVDNRRNHSVKSCIAYYNDHLSNTYHSTHLGQYSSCFILRKATSTSICILKPLSTSAKGLSFLIRHGGVTYVIVPGHNERRFLFSYKTVMHMRSTFKPSCLLLGCIYVACGRSAGHSMVYTTKLVFAFETIMP